MSTSLFDQLSDELILEVAKQIERRYGNTSLAPLALCSRRLNNVVGPLLYRTFTQCLDKPAALPKMLRTVMQKPLLGAEIETISLTDTDYEWLDMSSFLSSFPSRKLQTVMRSLEVSIVKSKWRTDVEQGVWDAAASLLLFFLPSLAEIELRCDEQDPFPYLDQIARHIACNQRIETPIGHFLSLDKLRKVSFARRSDNNYGFMDIGVILPWCDIPSVHTIRAFRLEGMERIGPTPEAWVSSALSKKYHVQSLRLDGSCVYSAALRTFLPSFSSLKQFYYHYGGADAMPADFLPQRIGEGLAQLHSSLEELVLLGTECGEDGEEARGPLDSLAEFTKLRCIGTEADVLFGPDLDTERQQLPNILPASLEILVIRRCEDDIYHDLRDLLSHRKDKFKVLKTVAIDIPRARAGGLNHFDPDELHQMEEEVRKRLARLTTDPHAAEDDGLLEGLIRELESLQSNQPTEEGWQEWRTRHSIEQKLIADYKKSGIELRFNLYSAGIGTRAGTWNFLPPFMVY